jgi:hypothetical protein
LFFIKKERKKREEEREACEGGDGAAWTDQSRAHTQDKNT